MEIQRSRYLKKLLDYQWDGQIKVITGLRRCGKSYILFKLFKERLLADGVEARQIIEVDLEDERCFALRNPLNLGDYVRKTLSDSKERHYLLIDEIQNCLSVPNKALPGGKITFYDVLNGLNKYENLDIYVTGSNSKMLVSEVATEFRGRGDAIRIHPLSFGEFYSAVGGDKREAFLRYARHGGMPHLVSLSDDRQKEDYLAGLMEETYLKDIVNRCGIARHDALEAVLDALCSSVGSLTNPTNLLNQLAASGVKSTQEAVRNYIGQLKDSFLFTELRRYDIKGNRYFHFPSKYYCEDVGLRNARLGFRQQEPAHLMENVIACELLARGFSVDVGVVQKNEKQANGSYAQASREIDFVVNSTHERFYIQAAFAIYDEAKMEQELRPFSLTGDSFRKIVVRGDIGQPWFDKKGVLHVSIYDFLLNEELLG